MRATTRRTADNHLGKVVRIETDGTHAGRQPVRGDASAARGLWSIGHRNVQGAALHPETGELWTNEHGPQGGDEVNARAAAATTAGRSSPTAANTAAATKIGEGTAKPGMEQPLTYWVPTSIAPSGMAFYTGDRFPEWRGSLFVGALAGQALWRLELDGNTVTARERLFDEPGRAHPRCAPGSRRLAVPADRQRRRAHRAHRA